ncbi:MAG TPA: lactate dehydrogenase [Nitrosopumilaceae archaeon]|nr:lactate dehydrogenase [Nitrosopumilaceae archaeon]
MISVIGAGKVGSAIGFLIASTSLDDLVLVNHNKNRAIGEALDITNAVPKGSTISVTGTDDYELTRDSKVIVIAASRGKIAVSRTDLLADNVSLIREIVNNIKKHNDDTKIIVVTNPLDVITYFTLKETQFSRKNVIGMGSSLDSSRFRYLLAKTLGVNQSKIEGIVIGEHGDSMVPIFSSARYDGKPISNMLDQIKVQKITTELRNYWILLKTFKDASVFGAAKNTFDLIKAIIYDEKLQVPASILLDGEYGLSNVCLGVPVIIGKNGVDKINEIELDKSELHALVDSSRVVQNNIKI